MKLLKFTLAAASTFAALSVHAQVPPLEPLSTQAVSTQAVISQKNLSYVHAMQLAQTAVAVCAQNNQSVAATVVDRSGIVLASLRSNGAGPTSYAGSERKAYTAVSFKTPTGTLMERSVNVPNLSNIPGTLALTGGVPIKVGNDVIGAIGVGGAPNGRIDEQCAEYAINEIRPLLGS